MVPINSTKYSTYEASNLQNVEFFYSDGTVVPSWLESGNSNTAASTVYWLNLVNGIPADSSITVNMGFASLTTDLFNRQTTGEAPQLSVTYGQYDDGSNVFSVYTNFAGTSTPSGWTQSGASSALSITMNNELTVANSGSSNQAGGVYYTNGISGSNNIFETYMTSDTAGTYQDGALGLSTATIGQGVGYFFSPHTDFDGDSFYSFSANPAPFGGGGGGSHGIDASQTSFVPAILSIYWFTTGTEYTGVNYVFASHGNSNQEGWTATQYPSLGIWSYADFTSVSMQWARVRIYPPGGVMPKTSLGSVTPAIATSVSCSPSSVPIGSPTICMATVTGKSPSGTVTWATSGAGTFSPSSCILVSGICSVAYTPSTITSLQTITANYQGDSNNAPASGTFPLSVTPSKSTTSVTCSPSPVPEGSPTTCTAVVGGYSPTGTVSWASSGVANFSPSSTCPLSAGSCAVTYTPSSISPVTITASYLGDQDNNVSSGVYNLEVSPMTTMSSSATVTTTVTTIITATTTPTTSTATTTVTSAITTTLAVPTTITGPTETITGPTSTTATTQTVTSTTSQSSSSVPTWAYATMVVLLIVGVAVGYVVKRPSASKR